jgi:hypothetical protein
MPLTRLWTGMRTQNVTDGDTDARIVLIINENGVDRLHHTFEDTAQEDQETGKANLYEVLNIGPKNITPGNLTSSSIRVGIRGEDAWFPQDFFVWGEQNGAVIPLAIGMNLATVLSTDQGDNNGNGRLSMPLPLVGLGSGTTTVRRLLALMVTSNVGTNSPVELRISGPTSILVDFDMPPPPPDASQDNQDAGEANFYYAAVGVPFTKNSLNAQSIRLSLQGVDDWRPASFFLFGLDKSAGKPDFIVPLVHLPSWNLGTLNSLTSSVTLPLI